MTCPLVGVKRQAAVQNLLFCLIEEHRLNRWIFHATIACIMSDHQNGSILRQELRALLHEQSQVIDQLLEKLKTPDASSVELVGLLENIEHLDRGRGDLARMFRQDVSTLRKREEDRSVRQVVLRALDFVGAPQPAWFLQEFVWARDRIDLKTRGFGSLRRDEFRAWRRRPGHRLAYVVPALDSGGRAVANLMARSDWPLADRLVVEDARRMYMLKGLEGVFRAIEELREPSFHDPYRPLVERCVAESGLGTPPLQTKGEVDRFLALLNMEIQDSESVVGARQAAQVETLTALPDELTLWGKP